MKRFVIIGLLLFLLSVHAQENELLLTVSADPILIGNTLDVSTNITNTSGINAGFVVDLTIANALTGDIVIEERQPILIIAGETNPIVFAGIDTADLDPNNYQVVLTAQNVGNGNIQTGVLYLEAIMDANITFVPEFHPLVLIVIIMGVLAVAMRK